MADINIERKRKSPLPWVLGLLALVLLAFMLMRSCGDDEAEPAVVVTDTTTAMTPAPMTDPMATAPMDSGAMAAGGAVPGGAAAGTGWIAGILAGTAAGAANGEGTVPETPSDRGFWIEENGQRIFAILAEPMEQIKDVDPGQRVRISNGRVLRGSESSQIPQDVDAEAKSTAQGQQYFLLVPSSGVQIVAGGNTTPD